MHSFVFLGAIYEGTANIQMSTVFKCMEQEAAQGTL